MMRPMHSEDMQMYFLAERKKMKKNSDYTGSELDQVSYMESFILNYTAMRLFQRNPELFIDFNLENMFAQIKDILFEEKYESYCKNYVNLMLNFLNELEPENEIMWKVEEKDFNMEYPYFDSGDLNNIIYFKTDKSVSHGDTAVWLFDHIIGRYVIEKEPQNIKELKIDKPV